MEYTIGSYEITEGVDDFSGQPEVMVHQDDELVATFHGEEEALDRACRFVAREVYLDKLAECLYEYEQRVTDDE